jgi:hypothetical protein
MENSIPLAGIACCRATVVIDLSSRGIPEGHADHGYRSQLLLSARLIGSDELQKVIGIDDLDIPDGAERFHLPLAEKVSFDGSCAVSDVKGNGKGKGDGRGANLWERPTPTNSLRLIVSSRLEHCSWNAYGKLRTIRCDL